jgi:alkanesulfonate monooxygenase SsuD/methylene tetrahydromethanopterin reductase-like flavin-dependent oxidoreductase (luciferase family)
VLSGTPDEYLAFGYDHQSPPLKMIRQLEEALKIIKLMFTQDGPSYSGKYYSITDVECYPKPIQKLYPPIMVGGTGEKHLHIGLHTLTKISFHSSEDNQYRGNCINVTD